MSTKASLLKSANVSPLYIRRTIGEGQGARVDAVEVLGVVVQRADGGGRGGFAVGPRPVHKGRSHTPLYKSCSGGGMRPGVLQ